MIQRRSLLWIFIGPLLAVSLSDFLAAKPLQVRVERWLEVRELSGSVMYLRGALAQQAQLGTRLQQVGDTIKTGPRSSTLLEVDTGSGFVSMAANTTVQVKAIQTLPSGGRLTRLQVVQGQARFRVKRGESNNSILEIETPGGVSAVRGTEFGVNVHPDGKTGIATLEGKVETFAQGQSVMVEAGFQTLLVPGEPPTRPIPFQEGTGLKLQLLDAINSKTVRIRGQVNPVNLLTIADVSQTLDRNGQFDIQIPLPASRRIEAVVVSPFGKRQVYELAVP
ncbi:MAG: FecR family protein [Leptolyngbyaceae cyanobacterium bins.59]|nr:FecR family protein [Leptolyngbyaceae cyanobacterium bins.59]